MTVKQIEKTKQFERKTSPLNAIENAVNQLYKPLQEDSRVQKARAIMGSEITKVSDEELEIQLTELQYLIDSWLDSFEQDLFNGKTLRQALGEG